MSMVSVPTPPSGTPAVVPYREHLASLARKRVAAGQLIWDPLGRVLLVDPVYKPHHDFPGGAAEEDESPRAAAAREVREELGVAVQPGRLLVVDYVPSHADRTEGLIYLFDGGVLDAATVSQLCPRPGELAGMAFVEVADAETLLSPLLGRRLVAAVDARREGTVAYLEDGIPVG